MNINRYIYSTLIFTIALLMSCVDDEKVRVPELGTGANVRIQLNSEFTNLNFDDIENAKVQYSVFSGNTDIETIEITVVYNNAVTGNESDPFPVKIYTQADFVDGVIRDEVLDADELASIVGLASPSEFNGGDFLVFSNVTTLSDGRVFPSPTLGDNLNVPPGIVNNPATQIFSVGWTSFVACPLPISYEGNYKVVATSGCNDSFGPSTGSDVVTLEQVEGPIYNLSGFNVFGFDDRNIDILFICGQILIINQSPQLGCGAVSVVYNTATTGAGTYDTDAETLSFTLNYESDNSCGGSFICENELVLEKQ